MKKKLFFIYLFIICVLSFFNVSAQSIAAGAAHSMYICVNNLVFTCGFNNAGQLGDGTLNNTTIPVQVNNLNNVIGISGGYHSLFLKNDGTTWACGYNGKGQLGDGTTIDKSIPIQVNNINSVTSVSAGETHFSLFLKSDSTAWACGENGYGQLGNGTADGNSHPNLTQVNGINKITQIAAGRAHCLFLKSDNTVWACGTNASGNLGDGTVIQRNIAVQVNGLGEIIAVAAGGGHSLFLKKDGTVWACGYNMNGQLGNGTSDNNPHVIPTQISTLTGIIAIAAGDGHSLFLKNDGTVWACGWNAYQQLGDGTTIDRDNPIQIGLTGITAIAGGLGHSVFLKNDGSVFACGWNANGQLGDGTNMIRSIPVQTSPLCGITAGINESSKENNISIYPNPFNSKVILESEQFTLTKIKITNYLGQTIFTLDNPISQKEIDLSSLPGGIYFLNVQSDSRQKVFKITKE